MISSPTTFVLGAGVSAPFGFPVGRQMKDAICNGGYQGAKNYIHTLPRDLMASLIAEATGRGDDLRVANEFLNSFVSSDMYSVDAWLEANGGDKDILNAGKAAIAAVILHAEGVAARDGADVEQDWFAWLWNILWKTNFEDLENNDFQFVSFNYDRLFEWKLERQVRNTYLRIAADQCGKVLTKLRDRIVHVHGMLGEVYPPGNGGDGFGKVSLYGMQDGGSERIVRLRQVAHSVERLIQGISIVSENPEDQKLVHKAKDKIQRENARLIFLGFSFDSRNIVKLDLDNHSLTLRPRHFQVSPSQAMDSAVIIGSAKGIRRLERETIEQMFGNRITLDEQELDAVEFCRSNFKVIRKLRS
jgi:hypothetical protein